MYFKELSTSDFFFSPQNSFLTETCLDSAFHQSIVGYSRAFSCLQRDSGGSMGKYELPFQA